MDTESSSLPMSAPALPSSSLGSTDHLFIPDEVIGEEVPIHADLCDEDSALAMAHATVTANHGIVLDVFTNQDSKWKGPLTTPDMTVYGACVEMQQAMLNICKVLRARRPETYPKRMRPIRMWATRWAKQPLSGVFSKKKKTREDLAGDTLRSDPEVMRLFKDSVEFCKLAEEAGVKITQAAMVQHKARVHNEKVKNLVAQMLENQPAN